MGNIRQRPILLLPVLLLCTLLIAGCSVVCCGSGVKGSGNLITRELQLPPAEKIAADGIFVLRVTAGQEQKIAATLDDNLFELLQAEVRDGTLVLDWKEECAPTKGWQLVIELSTLSGLAMDGAGYCTVAVPNGKSLSLELDGAANIEAEGQVASLDVVLDGVGNINAAKLLAEKVKVTLDGVGNIHVHPTGDLAVALDGVGNVYYSGEPKNVTQLVDGVGRVLKE
jgi:hypothetical protein